MSFVVWTLALVGGLLILAGLLAEPRPRRRKTTLGNPLPNVAAALAGGSAALVVTAVPAFALLSALVASTVPNAIRARKRRAARAQLAQSWPSILDDITSAVRAGLNLPEALAVAGVRAPEGLRDGFEVFGRNYRRTGDFERSLQQSQLALRDPVFDQLAGALMIARSVGGHDLTTVLRSLGNFIRADLQVRGELLARQSWSVNAARMAVAAPWVVLVMLSTRPSTLPAYRTLTGSLLLIGVAMGSVVAYSAMLRIARLDGART